MSDRDSNASAQSAAPSDKAAERAAFKALNQSHWRAVEELLEGLREGRSIMVLAGEPGAGAPAVVREMISCLPRRMQAVESGRQAATLRDVSEPLHAALCAGASGLGEDDRPTEQVRAALERLACEDRGVVYVVDPEDALTEDALVYLARLAAGGRRLTRERQAAREKADAPLKGPVGAQIVLCAPPEALEALAGLGDSALRRAAEAPIRIHPFDGPALRAAFRQHTGAVLEPEAVSVALAATKGDPAALEALLGHGAMLRAAKSDVAKSGAEGGEPIVVSAEITARVVDELGISPSGGIGAPAADAPQQRSDEAVDPAAASAASEDAPQAEHRAAPAPFDAANARRAEETDDFPELDDFEAAQELDADPASNRGLLGFGLAAPTLDALDEALIDAILEEDLSGADPLEEIAINPPAPVSSAPPLVDLEDEELEADHSEGRIEPTFSEEIPAYDPQVDEAVAAGEPEVEHASSLNAEPEPAESDEAPEALDQETLDQETLNQETLDRFEETALLGALDAAEASITPEAMASAGAESETAQGGLLAALGMRRRPSAAERLRLERRPPARTLGAARRHAMVAAALSAALAAGAILHFGAVFDDGSMSLADDAAAERRIETADAKAPGGQNQDVEADEASADAQPDGKAEALTSRKIWNGVLKETISAVEYAVRGAAVSVAPTDDASEGLNRLADDLFNAGEDLTQERLEQELAALDPEEAKVRREERIADALRRAQDHATAGRYTGPEGSNAYQALLEGYRLSPRDPRVRGALAALVEHYDREAQQALSAERYEVFHRYNRVADRIRARLPI